MKKEAFHAWLSERVRNQARLTMAACTGMVVVGLLALLIQGGILYLLLSLAYNAAVAVAVLLLLLGIGGLYVWTQAPGYLDGREHDVEIGFRTVTIKLMPTLANTWTYAVGSLETDQSIPERLVNLFLLIPRMFITAVFVFRRVAVVKEIDVESCGKVIRLVLRKSESVQVADVAEKWPDMDIPATMKQLSVIDGIVFLTKDYVAISIANRFKDDLEHAIDQSSPDQEPAGTPFD